MNKKYKYIDLSGYAFTGKGAYNNLFAEFRGYHTHPYDFEFDIVRTQNGILDLYISLVQEWSPIRSCESIRNFKKLIKSYGGNKTFLDRLMTNGRHYDSAFKNFTKLSNQYIDNLVDSSWKGQWPFAFEKMPKFQIFIYKVLFNIGHKTIFEDNIYLSVPKEDKFIELTREYLNDILSSNVSSNVSTIVMNNVFESFTPLKSMKFFHQAKSIVIDRDPRDIYLSLLDHTNLDGSKGFKVALGSDIQGFIQRFKLYRDRVDYKNNENILRVTFEDLVLKYDMTLETIFNFLDEDESIHINKKKYFDPEISKKGVGMWKNVDGQLKKDIKKIQVELKEYCKDY